MGSSGVRAGQAYVEVYADIARLVKNLDQAQARLEAFSVSVGAAGTKMTALSAAVLSPIAAGTKVFADFETQMANVATVLERPEEFLGRFKKELQGLSVQFGESTDTLAKGLYDILSASIPPEKAMGVLAVAAKAAKAGLSDTATAVDAITTVLNAYGLSADQAGRVSDWMFQTVLRGKITFSDLAGEIGKTASLAYSAGLTLDEVGAFIATLTRSGVQSSAAMTGLNAVIKAFLKPSDDASKAAAAIGFEMSGATLKSQGLLGVFQGLSKLPPETLARLFPDIDALKAVLPAMNNLSAFGQDVAAMAGAAGSTETAYSKMADTTATSFARLREAGMTALEALGEVFAVRVKGMAGSLTEMLIKVREWISSNQQLVIQAAIVAVGVGALGTGFLSAAAALKVMAVGVGAVSAALGIGLSMFGAVGGMVATVFGSPLLLAAAALAAFAASFVAVPTKVSVAFGWLGKVISVGWEGVRRVLVAGWELLQAVWSGDNDKMAKAWEKFTFRVRDLWVWAQKVFWIGVGYVERLWKDRTKILQETWDDTQAKFKTAWDKTGDHLRSAWKILQGNFANTTPQMQDAWAAFCRFVSEENGKTLGVTRDEWDDLVSFIEARLRKPIDGLRSLMQDLLSMWRSFWDNMNAIVEDVTGFSLKNFKESRAGALMDPTEMRKRVSQTKYDAQLAASVAEYEAAMTRLETRSTNLKNRLRMDLQPLVGSGLQMGGFSKEFPGTDIKVVDEIKKVVKELADIKIKMNNLGLAWK